MRNLNIEEMDELIDLVQDEIPKILYKANRAGNIDDILKVLGLEELAQDDFYDTTTTGKIVVIGKSQIKEKEIYGIGKSLGLTKDRFELCLDYNKAKTYDYKKLQYNPHKYSVVIFGAVPHSSTGKGNSGSVISEMQRNQGYPRTYELSAGGKIKITKSNFKEKLIELIDLGVISI